MTSQNNIEALNQIQYGVFIVSARLDEKINAQIATVVFQATSDPIQIVTCLHKDNFTHELIMKSKKFGISILSEKADLKFIGRFGFRCGRDFNKCEGINYKTINTDCPLITENASSILDLEVTKTLDVGTHTLFVGKLLCAEK